MQAASAAPVQASPVRKDIELEERTERYNINLDYNLCNEIKVQKCNIFKNILTSLPLIMSKSPSNNAENEPDIMYEMLDNYNNKSDSGLS